MNWADGACVLNTETPHSSRGWERWGNLPRERDRLFALLVAADANGVIFLSGDRHLGALYRRDDLLPYPLYEVTSSSLNRPFPDAAAPGPRRIGNVYGHENFGVVQIDWRTGAIDLELLGLDGAVARHLSLTLLDITARTK